MLVRKIYQKLFFLNNTGLGKLPKDDRDLGYAFSKIFGIEYTPKLTRNVLNLPFIAKSQNYNTCGWTASAGAKEFDEKMELDERSLIIFGKIAGLISGDGFSNLRDNEIVLKDTGIAEKNIITTAFNSWETYSNVKLATKEVLDNAAKHKIKSFSRIYSTSEVYRAIDQGRPVKIGVGWRTNMNMSGGFSIPWILNFLQGLLVGGHAMFIYGYDQQYKTQKVFMVRNSFGKSFGNNGDCYIIESNLQKQIDYYGAYVNLDMDKDMISWLAHHNGKIVKTSNKPDVFLILGELKHKFPDLATLYSHNFHDQDITIVSNEYLDSVKTGSQVDFWAGENVRSIKAIIQQKENLKPLFEKYFNELF